MFVKPSGAAGGVSVLDTKVALVLREPQLFQGLRARYTKAQAKTMRVK